MRNRILVSVITTGLILSACGQADDGATVRDLGESEDESVSASASSASGSSGSSSAPATGETGADSASTTSDGGYDYASNVDAHRLVVADLCSIGDSLDAGDFDAVEMVYRDGGNSVNSDGSIRTIAGFALSEDRLHDVDDYYGTPTPLDDFVTAALAGTGPFEGTSDAVRSQGVEKGMRNQVMIAWVIHELNSAMAKADEGNFDIAEGAVHNWDEAWAFYHGSEPGCAPFATGNSRAANFGTLGSDGETARANEAILTAMSEGRDALLAENPDGAKAAVDQIQKNVVIIYSQASIRYASVIEDDLAADDAESAKVHQAEGLAFWRVIEPYVGPAGAEVDTINAIYGLENEPGANGFGDDIQAALDPALTALGITPEDIGVLE